MGFKPTIIKSIVSLLGGVLAGYLSSILLPPNIICGIESCFEVGKSNWVYVIFLVAVVLMYVIWSLVTKKK
ncbi:hypothetical protein HYY69_06940 [Candidatus Woesearchaeota archaeon]|nr:hypothetical protein [Candidatus Woesearchaeota archaeon]